MITGTLKPAKLVWLPVLAHIPPPNIWCQNAPINCPRSYRKWHTCHCSGIYGMHCTTNYIAVQHTFHQADNIISLLWWTGWERASATTSDSLALGFPHHLWRQINEFRCGIVHCPKTDYACGLCIYGAVKDAAHMLDGCSFCVSLEVFSNWTLLVQRPLTGSRPISCFFVFFTLVLLVLPPCNISPQGSLSSRNPYPLD